MCSLNLQVAQGNKIKQILKLLLFFILSTQLQAKKEKRIYIDIYVECAAYYDLIGKKSIEKYPIADQDSTYLTNTFLNYAYGVSSEKLGRIGALELVKRHYEINMNHLWKVIQHDTTLYDVLISKYSEICHDRYKDLPKPKHNTRVNFKFD